MILFTRGSFCNTLIASTISIFPKYDYDASDVNSNMGINTDMKPAAQFVRQEVKDILKDDPKLAGSILRLAFHDAIVHDKSTNPNIDGGSNGSIRFELDYSENRGLSKPLKAIEKVYDAQRINCQTKNINTINNDCQSQILSFADVLALSGAAAVEYSKGPQILIKLGRKDQNTPDNKYLDEKIISESERSSITTSLPSAALDSLGLRNFFVQRLGFTELEMVALMGSHDLGRHVTLTGMPRECLKNLSRQCLEDAPTLAPFVTKDPDSFSNAYFETLLRWNENKIEYGEAAFIPTDVALVVDDGLKELVVKFANDEELFFETFATAYQKLVDSTATTSMRY